MRTSGGSFSSCYKLGFASGNPYNGGSLHYSSNGGASWLNYNTYDFTFRTYGIISSNTNKIETNVDNIIPYEITENPHQINIINNTAVDNVSLFYRYSTDNDTWQYNQSDFEIVWMNNINIKQVNPIDMVDDSSYIWIGSLGIVSGGEHILRMNKNDMSITYYSDETTGFDDNVNDMIYITILNKIYLMADEIGGGQCLFEVSTPNGTPSFTKRFDTNQATISTLCYVPMVNGYDFIFIADGDDTVYKVNMTTWSATIYDYSNLLDIDHFHACMNDSWNNSHIWVTTRNNQDGGAYLIRIDVENPDYMNSSIWANSYIDNMPDDFVVLKDYIIVQSEDSTSIISRFNKTSEVFEQNISLDAGHTGWGVFYIEDADIIISTDNMGNVTIIDPYTFTFYDSWTSNHTGGGSTNEILFYNNEMFVTHYGNSNGANVTKLRIFDWNLFGMNESYPFSFSFDFPEGNGYYEFYSIGKKIGETDEPIPSFADAICKKL
jgi:hypothetical protein